jgi:hypothetical protein
VPYFHLYNSVNRYMYTVYTLEDARKERDYHQAKKHMWKEKEILFWIQIDKCPHCQRTVAGFWGHRCESCGKWIKAGTPKQYSVK